MKIFWGHSPPSRSSFLRKINFPKTRAWRGREARVTPLKLFSVNFNMIYWNCLSIPFLRFSPSFSLYLRLWYILFFPPRSAQWIVVSNCYNHKIRVFLSLVLLVFVIFCLNFNLNLIKCKVTFVGGIMSVILQEIRCNSTPLLFAFNIISLFSFMYA